MRVPTYSIRKNIHTDAWNVIRWPGGECMPLYRDDPSMWPCRQMTFEDAVRVVRREVAADLEKYFAFIEEASRGGLKCPKLE